MKYFFIDTLGDLNNSSLCILDTVPQGIGIKWYKPVRGEPAQKDWPEDPRMYMSEEHPGIKLPSLIGNTKRYLIAHRDIKKAVEHHCEGVDIEYLPIKIYNHRRRKHSEAYFVINPLRSFDVLDHNKSFIDYLEGEILGITHYVLSTKKLKDAPALFRIPEQPNRYIINETLANDFQERKLTNILLKEIAQSDENSAP